MLLKTENPKVNEESGFIKRCTTRTLANRDAFDAAVFGQSVLIKVFVDADCFA